MRPGSVEDGGPRFRVPQKNTILRSGPESSGRCEVASVFLSGHAMNRPEFETALRVAPAGCRTLVELRAQIDRLDRILVRLLAERQGYIERAAEIKTDRTAIRDEARIEDVLSKVLTEAARAGLATDIAAPVWRALVERSIVHEFAAFDAKGHT